MATWPVIIIPIVIVGIVVGILIKKRQNKTGNTIISENPHMGKTEKEVNDEWGGI